MSFLTKAILKRSYASSLKAGGFKVLTEVLLKIQVFWDMKYC